MNHHSLLMAEGEISVIFLLPLVMSTLGALFYLGAEVSTVSKGIVLGLVGISVFLQFGPIPGVHFFIPLALQLIVCFWLAIFWQME